MAQRYALIFLLFFLIVFLTPVSAYEIFSYNANFSNDINGYIMFQLEYNQTIGYNATCYGASGCYLAESNASTLTTRLYALDNPNIPADQQLTSTSQFAEIVNISGYLSVTIPANEEIITILSYYLNDTLDPVFPVPRLQIVDAIDSSIITFENLNGTAGGWHNYSIISDSSNVEREVVVDLFWATEAGSPTIMAIDKFKLYTVDTTETRQYWTSNETSERERYCGSGASAYTSLWSANNDDFETFGSIFGSLFCIDIEDTNIGIFKLGNNTVARRIISEDVYADYDPDFGSVYVFRDMYYMIFDKSGSFGYTAKAVITKVVLNSMTISVFDALENPNEGGDFDIYDSLMGYDNSPQPWADMLVDHESGILFDYEDYVKAEVNTTSYFNDTVAGLRWQLCGMNNSEDPERCATKTPFYDFFTSTILCAPSVVCDPSTNTKYVITITCDIINQVSCNEWGCNEALTGCKYDIVGSFCLNDLTIQTVNATGHSSYSYCESDERCYNITTILAECLTETEHEEYNQTRANYSENFAEATAYGVAAIFGITDDQDSKDIFSLIISLVLGVAVAVFFAVKSKKAEMSSMLTSFMGVFMVMLILFSVAGFLSAWITLSLFALILIGLFMMVKSGG